MNDYLLRMAYQELVTYNNAIQAIKVSREQGLISEYVASIQINNFELLIDQVNREIKVMLSDNRKVNND